MKFLLIAIIFAATSIYPMDANKPERNKRQKKSSEYSETEFIIQHNLRNPQSLVDLAKYKIAEILTSINTAAQELSFSTNLLKNISLLEGPYKDMIYQALIEENWLLLISSYKPYQNYKILNGHKGGVLSVAISPDCKLALTGSEDKTAILWDTKNFDKVQVLEGHTDVVTSVTFSPDGQYILTGSLDKTVILWKLSEGGSCKNKYEKVGEIGRFSDSITSLALSPNGEHLLIGLFGIKAVLLNMNTLEKIELHVPENIEDMVQSSPISVTFSSNGKYALINSWNKYTIWNIYTLKKIISLESANLSSAAFSPDCKLILTGSRQPKALLRDINLEEIGVLQGHSSCVNSAAFSSNGKSALTGSFDKTAILWDIKKLKKIAILKGHTQSIRSVAFSADNKFILTGAEDNKAIAWNLSLPELTLEALVRVIIINKLSSF